MEEIAAQAGLGKASLYYYHSTKEELFQAVVDRKFAEFQRRVERLLVSGTSVHSRIRSYVGERFEFFSNLLNLYIIDFQAIPKNRPVLRNLFRVYADRELGWLTQLFGEGKQLKAFALQSPEGTAEVFLHIQQGLRLRYMRANEASFERSDPSEVLREQLAATDIFLRGIQRSGADDSCPGGHIGKREHTKAKR
jgi:TetR/AcrR family transcriptional regulator